MTSESDSARTKPVTWLFGAVMLFLLLRCTINSNERDRQEDARRASDAASAAAAEATMTPAQKQAAATARAAASAAAAVAEAQFQTGVLIARRLRDSLNNPRSFELVSAFRTTGNAYCFEFRGTNSFNAVVLNYAVVPSTGSAVSGPSSTVAKAWNRHCADKPNVDMSYMRHVI